MNQVDMLRAFVANRLLGVSSEVECFDAYPDIANDVLGVMNQLEDLAELLLEGLDKIDDDEIERWGELQLHRKAK